MNTETATIDQNTETLLNVISDAVIFDRLHSGISKLLNNGDVDQNSIEQEYNGIYTAFSILRVTSEEEEEILRDIFLNYSERPGEPRIAAAMILENWQKVLKLSN